MSVQEPAARPRALRDGSRVALVAPAGPVDPDRIEGAQSHCRALGLVPVLYPGASRRTGYLAGSDEERLTDLQSAFDDPSIDAVWALRGGYGTLRVLDRLDLSRQRTDPIPFIGFSDNTTIHVRHAAIGVVSFHGPHPGIGLPAETDARLRATLFSSEPTGPLASLPTDPPPRAILPGRVEAPLYGGNLSILASLCGSRDAPSARGRILFLEEVGEAAYRVDRLLVQLERSGALEGVVGLAFGRFTAAPSDEGDRPPPALDELARRLGVPAVGDLPFGHVPHNSTLPVGARAALDGEAATLSIVEGAVKTE